MGEVFGSLLPFIAGIALSPVPVIAVILTLFSERGKSASVGFLAGWMLGLTALTTIVALLAGLIPTGGGGEPSVWVGWLKVLLGVALLWLAVRNWRSRPKPGEEAETPGWMKSVDTLGFGGALRLGVLLSAVNPKVTVMCVTVGLGLGTAGLGVTALIVAVLVFVVLSSVTIGGPVIANLVAGERLHAPLTALRDWIARENHTIMAVLFTVLGLNAFGAGLGIIWP